MLSEQNWVEASYTTNPTKLRTASLESRTLYNTLPLVTSLSWSIIDAESCQLIAGKAYRDRREVASLTKIMTAYICIQYCQTETVDINKVYLEVSKSAAFINGTVAGLRMGHRLKIYDLLYALMLPSGNDAALVLAEGLGKRMYNKELKKNKHNKISPNLLSKIYTDLFVRKMNKTAAKLGLINTVFANPHGLADRGNKSTAEDIGRLSAIAKKQPVFSQIVKTPTYHANAIDEKGGTFVYTWESTNQLLSMGYDGVKTGMTPTAGPCLVLSQTCNGIGIIVTVLGARTQEHKWVEGVQIMSWAMNRLSKYSDQKPKSSSNVYRKKLKLASFMVYKTLLS